MGIFDIFRKDKRKNNDVAEPAQAPSAEYGTPEYDAGLREALTKLSSDDRQKVLDLIANGDTIMAVKICKDNTGLGLRDAKEIIDRFEEFIK